LFAEGDKVFFDADGSSYCLNTVKGNLLWESNLPNPNDRPMLIANGTGKLYGTYITRSLEQILFCIDSQTGNILWRSNCEDCSSHNEYTLSKDRIYTYQGGTVISMNSYNGNIIWEKVFWEKPDKNGPFAPFGTASINGIVQKDDNLLFYYGSYHSTPKGIACLDRESGILKWRQDIDFKGVGHYFTVFGNKAILITGDYPNIQAMTTTLFCYDIDNGKEIWRTSKNLGYSDTEPVNTLVGDKIIVSNEVASACFDASSGRLLWENKFSCGWPWPPVGYKNLLITPNGCLNLTNGTQVKQTYEIKSGWMRYLITNNRLITLDGSKVACYEIN